MASAGRGHLPTTRHTRPPTMGLPDPLGAPWGTHPPHQETAYDRSGRTTTRPPHRSRSGPSTCRRDRTYWADRTRGEPRDRTPPPATPRGAGRRGPHDSFRYELHRPLDEDQ